eukprot:scaffold31018_cov63-Phaeocystis_antarctica.AAC.1
MTKTATKARPREGAADIHAVNCGAQVTHARDLLIRLVRGLVGRTQPRGSEATRHVRLGAHGAVRGPDEFRPEERGTEGRVGQKLVERRCVRGGRYAVGRDQVLVGCGTGHGMTPGVGLLGAVSIAEVLAMRAVRALTTHARARDRRERPGSDAGGLAALVHPLTQRRVPCVDAEGHQLLLARDNRVVPSGGGWCHGRHGQAGGREVIVLYVEGLLQRRVRSDEPSELEVLLKVGGGPRHHRGEGGEEDEHRGLDSRLAQQGDVVVHDEALEEVTLLRCACGGVGARAAAAAVLDLVRVK